MSGPRDASLIFSPKGFRISPVFGAHIGQSGYGAAECTVKMYLNTKSLAWSRKYERKSRIKRRLAHLGDGIKEFSELTSLHGFKYIGENRSVSER